MMISLDHLNVSPNTPDRACPQLPLLLMMISPTFTASGKPRSETPRYTVPVTPLPSRWPRLKLLDLQG